MKKDEFYQDVDIPKIMFENINPILIYNQESASHSIELFNYLSENDISDWSELFDTNPDLIKMEGKEYPFVCIKYSLYTIVIYIDVEYMVLKTRIEYLLQKFFSDDFLNYYEKQECNWNYFTDNCIAYRYGEGVGYCIWKWNSF